LSAAVKVQKQLLELEYVAAGRACINFNWIVQTVSR